MPAPKSQWPTTQALVYTVDWYDATRSDPGHYDVTFSYNVDGARYTGTFSDYGKSDEPYLHRNDEITIRYNAAHPQQCEYPAARGPRRVLPRPILWCLRIFCFIFVVLLVLSLFRK